jgi:hypothetical protein
MKNQSYLKILVFGFIYVLAFKEFSYLTADPDLWGHILFGKEIWESGSIPRTDSYSFTANGQPWINHEWLTEVLFYLIYANLGSGGLLAFKMILGWTIIFLLSQSGSYRKNPYPFALTSILIIPVMGPGFMVRPQLMTFLFAAILIYILRKFFKENSRWVFCIPAIFLLWINCHGGVIAGLGILGAVTAIQWFLTRQSEFPSWKPLAIVLAGSCLTVLINPYGIELWTFFIKSLSLPRKINEWAPIPLFDLSHLPFKVLTLVFLISIIGNRKKQLWEVGIITISIIFAFKSQRHTVLAAIVSAPYLADWVTTLANNPLIRKNLETLSTLFKKISQIALGLFIVFQIIMTGYSYNQNKFQIFVEPTVYPVYLAQFLERNDINGNIISPFDWGEYLIWKRPKSKVAIDGRFRTVYPEHIIRQAWNFWERKENWREILKNSDIAVVKTTHAGDKGFANSSKWEKIYKDPICIVYLKQNKRNNDFITKFRQKKLINPNVLPPYFFPG